MVKIKFGSLITNMSGKIGGQVYSHNSAGPYLRNIGTIAVAPTAYQITSQVRMATLVTAWKALTAEQRASWQNAVVNYRRSNVFADTYTLTGYNLFMSLNTIALIIGEAVMPFPPFPTPADQINSFAVVTQIDTTWALSAGALAAVPASEAWILEATPQVPATKNNVKNLLSIITVLAPGAGIPLDIKGFWTAKFGAPTIGMNIVFKLTPVNTVSKNKRSPISPQFVFTVTA